MHLQCTLHVFVSVNIQNKFKSPILVLYQFIFLLKGSVEKITHA